ncbi:MAG: c-type cytochrome [Xanthobacteraceae bacterium]
MQRSRRNWIALSVAAVALLGAPVWTPAWTPAWAPAWAQEHGDASRGATLAVGVCVACHGVRKGEGSVNPLAPPFTVIADVRGMSAMALHVALQTSHRSMPNIVLDPQERADVVAYILSLKSR